MRLRRRRDERGAVLVLMAVLSVVLFTIGAFAVDIGMQRVARRDMQALADLVSLDLARQLDGRTAGEIVDLQALADRSRNRNAGAVGNAPPTVTPVLGEIAPDGTFSPVASGVVPTAVRVLASTAVDFSIAPGSGAATRSAVATSTSTACFSVGSYAARTGPGNHQLLSLINVAFDSPVDVVSYQGLSKAHVSLAELAAELSVASPENLASLSTLKVSDFYLALARVLTRQGDTAQAELLNRNFSRTVNSLLVFDLENVLSVGQGGGSALDANLNVLDLVTGAALAATGDNGATVPVLMTNVPGFVTTSASVKVVEAPRIGCGPVGTQAKTSQVGVSLTGRSSPPLKTASYHLTATQVDLTLDLDVASATAELAAIRCAPESLDITTVSGLVTPNLTATVVISAFQTNPGGPISFTVRVPVSMTAPRATTAGSAQVNMPPYETAVSSSPKGSLLSGGMPVPVIGPAEATLTLLGVPYPLSVSAQKEFTDAVAGYVNATLLPNLDATIAPAVRDVLGMDIAGVDLFGMARPNCTSPALVSGPSN